MVVGLCMVSWEVHRAQDAVGARQGLKGPLQSQHIILDLPLQLHAMKPKPSHAFRMTAGWCRHQGPSQHKCPVVIAMIPSLVIHFTLTVGKLIESPRGLTADLFGCPAAIASDEAKPCHLVQNDCRLMEVPGALMGARWRA